MELELAPKNRDTEIMAPENDSHAHHHKMNTMNFEELYLKNE